MRRYLPLCLLAILLTHLTGCGEAPTNPSVVTNVPTNPPKRNARFIQVPWDISLLFNLPGGAVVTGATAATAGGAAEGDNLTGTFVNSTGFAGTLTGVLTGTLENGNFNGTLSTILQNGCTAERRFSGPITTAALNWSPGAHINDCGGATPLTTGIQVTAAPPSAPPPCLTYEATATGTSVPAAGGAGTVTVTAAAGCTWFATSSATFVSLSASQSSGDGSVQFTVAANTSTTQRTAVVVVAGHSFTITQAPAQVCTYRLNGGERTFDANGALGGVDMRVAPGCAWQAQSDAPWLTITSGASGSGDGTINYAVAGNPTLTSRVGRITATGDQDFTVTQLGIVCAFTVTPAPTAFPYTAATGTASVVTQAPCPWAASSNVPWITITPPPGGTGNGAVAFTVAANPDPVARAGVLTVAGREIAITQAAAPCVFTVTPPTTTAFPAAGGTGSATVATHSACAWTAASSVPWITVTPPAGGTGNGTAAFTVAANPDPVVRNGTLTVAGREIAISQAAACVFTLTPSSTSVPFSGGTGSIGIATLAGCAWTAAVSATSPWITITGGGSGSGPGTVQLSFAANPTAQQRTGTVTIGTATVTFTQAPTTLGSLTGVVTNSINRQPVADATVSLTVVGGPAALTTATNAAGRYTFSNVQQGTYNVLIQKTGFDDARNPSPITISAALTATFDATLVARPVNLAITWNPNPTSVNAANPTCGLPNVSFCWQSNTVITETSGTAAPVATLTLHFFDPAGAPAPPVAGSWTPTTILGGGTFTGTGTVTLPTGAGGGVEFEYAGTDGFGRAFSFRSPRLTLSPFSVIRLASPIEPAGVTGVTGTGGVQPATRPIRRR